jgi:hypothetical protein
MLITRKVGRAEAPKVNIHIHGLATFLALRVMWSSGQ